MNPFGQFGPQGKSSETNPALVIRRSGKTLTNSGERQLQYGARKRTHGLQLRKRGHPAPQFDLHVLGLPGRVAVE